MLTPKENFLALLNGDNPKWLGDPWSCFVNSPMFRPCIFDAVTMVAGNPQPGDGMKVNNFGVTMDWPANQPGAAPYITEENRVVKDITCWKDFVKFPDLDHLPWGPADGMAAQFMQGPNNRDERLFMVPSFMGMFEYSHMVLGFEEALMDFLLEPEAMFDMLSAYTDWKIKSIELVIDHWHPDVIHSHDDWGNKKSMFISPDTWREIIKPQYERFYGYIKSRGVLIQHHSDCVNDAVAEDMVELGIDMWQGVIPQNDIKSVIDRTKGELCVMGGFDMQLIDYPDMPDEKIEAAVREVIDTYMPMIKPYGKGFIPCVTNVFPVNRNVEVALNKELDRYGAEYAAKNF